MVHNAVAASIYNTRSFFGMNNVRWLEIIFFNIVNNPPNVFFSPLFCLLSICLAVIEVLLLLYWYAGCLSSSWGQKGAVWTQQQKKDIIGLTSMTVAFHCKLMIYAVSSLTVETDQIIFSVLSFVLVARQTRRPGLDTKLFSVVFLWKSEWQGPAASLISAWRRRAGDESVSLGFTSAILQIAGVKPSESERFFSLPHAYQSSELSFEIQGKWHPLTTPPPPKNPQLFCLCWWASEEFSIEADGVKARAASYIPVREILPSSRAHKREIGPPFIESRAISCKKCIFLDLKCSSVNFHQEETSGSLLSLAADSPCHSFTLCSRAIHRNAERAQVSLHCRTLQKNMPHGLTCSLRFHTRLISRIFILTGE